MISSVSDCPVDEKFHGDDTVVYSGNGDNGGDISGNDGDGRRNISSDGGEKRGDISVNDDRCGSRSKETSQYNS